MQPNTPFPNCSCGKIWCYLWEVPEYYKNITLIQNQVWFGTKLRVDKEWGNSYCLMWNGENVIWKNKFYFGFGYHGNNLNEKVCNYSKLAVAYKNTVLWYPRVLTTLAFCVLFAFLNFCFGSITVSWDTMVSVKIKHTCVNKLTANILRGRCLHPSYLSS